jgi:hypothetical protein
MIADMATEIEPAPPLLAGGLMLDQGFGRRTLSFAKRFAADTAMKVPPTPSGFGGHGYQERSRSSCATRSCSRSTGDLADPATGVAREIFMPKS